MDQGGVYVDDQRIIPGRRGGGVKVSECVPRPGPDGANRPGHLLVDAIGVVGELVDSAVGGGHRAKVTGQAGVDQGTEQVQVIQAGGAGGQRDEHRCHYRAGSVGDGVGGQAGELFVEDIGDTEGAGGVGDQQSARVGAECPVGGNVDQSVGSLHLEGDPVLPLILA